MEAETAFPEAGLSPDPAAVPWDDAVVWVEPGPKRLYRWLTTKHVKSVAWADGVVAVQIAGSSLLGGRLSHVILQAPFVTVGRNVPV